MAQSDGSLSEDISVTSEDAYSTDDSSVGSHSVSTKQTSDLPYTEQARLCKLQRRRNQFLRRRALEKAAALDDDESTVHYGRPRLGLGFPLKNNLTIPSQELRLKDSNLTKIDSPATLASSFNNIDLSEHESKDFDSTNAAWSPDKFVKDPFIASTDNVPDLVNNTSNDVPDLVNTSNDDSFLLNTSEESQANVTKPTPRWASFSTTFPKLSAIPPEGLNFLESSHLGPKVVSTQWTRTEASSLQLGDVIIRLNGEDVSNLEADTVSQMMIRMDDCRIVTYLRKNVEL